MNQKSSLTGGALNPKKRGENAIIMVLRMVQVQGGKARRVRNLPGS